MNKSKILLILFTGFILSFGLWSCKTTDVVEAEETVVEQEQEPKETVKEPVTTKPAKEEKKPEEPKDPPNIAFAKKLQALLEKGDVKGAIALFDKIPSELKDDLELKLVLASLYVSDGNYDMAINVADQVLAVDASNLTALEIKTLCAKANGDSSAYKAAAKAILAADPYNMSFLHSHKAHQSYLDLI